MTIHDPDVVFTDLALALLGLFLAWRLRRLQRHDHLTRTGIVLLLALASAAFFGAVFHAFFIDGTETTAGYLAWLPVVLSIVVLSSALLGLALRLLAQGLPRAVRSGLVGLYAVTFAIYALLVDESYGTIVRFYGPVLLLFLVASVRRALQDKTPGWWLLAASFAVSIVAALVQQGGVALHPVWFDHNALYHVVQGIAIVMLYVAFKRIGGAASTDR